MKFVLIAAVLSIVVLSFVFNGNGTQQSINPIIGDISFVETFGYKPTQNTNNELRVRTHLLYVEQALRRKNVKRFPVSVQAKRNHLLDLLHSYALAGNYPKNFDFAEQRKPCFIDKNNTICAVGYLIEQTTNRKTAEEINAKFKYENLLAMRDVAVDEWIAGSGLSRQECAMIQPTYGPTPSYTYNHIPKGYGIASSIVGGVNLSLNSLNGIQIAKGTSNKGVAIAGMLAGTGQILLGSTMFPKKMASWNGSTPYTNESQNTLSMINIGLGTTTLILSSWNLIANRKFRNTRTSWNIYNFPAGQNRNGIAVSMTRNF